MQKTLELLTKKNLIEKSLKIRAFEQVLIENFFKLNSRGTVHTSIGQELLPVILTELLLIDDYIFGTHRSHGIYLSMTSDFEGLLAEVLGVKNATSSGLGGSQHLNFKNLYTNGIQGGMAPLANGSAHTLLGSENISICFLGDGTFGQGVLYEALNQASYLRTPTLFIVEDNHIAQSTLTKKVIKGTIKNKIESFDIKTTESYSDNFDDLYSNCLTAITGVRKNRRPSALIVNQNRLASHSKGDDNRDEAEIAQLYQNDLLQKYLNADGELEKYFNTCREEFIDLINLVKDNEPANKTHIDYSLEVNFKPTPIGIGKPETIREYTYIALDLLLSQSTDTFLLGQDIEYLQDGTTKPYFGAFGVTKNLSQKYPNQVKNSSISESSMVGFGIGRALAGKVTIVEIMFGDFTTLIVDQLRQQASKIVGMYGTKKRIPLIIRTPMGGRRGYGPTHSQNLENMFISIPNIIVYSQNVFFEPNHYLVLGNIGLPIVIIEHKDLYNENPNIDLVPLYEKAIMDKNEILVYNKAKEKSKLIITYGYAASLSIKAVIEIANHSEKFFDVLVLSIISPLTLQHLKSTIEEYSEIFLIEECDSKTGLAGSIIVEMNKIGLVKNLKTLGGNGIIGASQYSESESLISVQKIKNLIGQK
jgi:2-oxoisovalerate dehydrogenase E1 component